MTIAIQWNGLAVEAGGRIKTLPLTIRTKPVFDGKTLFFKATSMFASSNAVSRRMARTAGKGNPRELALRSALHHQGLRFRVHYAALAGTRRTIDIAFTRLRLAVFCDGCFWHGCPIHATAPKANRDWWADKLAANKARDLDIDTKLANGGWTVLRLRFVEGLVVPALP